MRVLLLMRGTPSCGKSTWIKNNGLEEYTLSADDIRLLYRSKTINKDGKEYIDQSVNSFAWKTLFDILEKRMSFGEFTVIDACNSKTKEMNMYKSLAEQYRYRMFCVDFTDIPIEQAKEWNRNRPEYKQVPENAIDLYYSRFATQKIPSGIKMITRENAINEIQFNSINLDKYNKIYVIGDIHGCYTALMELIDNGLKDDCYYIFLGDYLDRGIENKQVLEFIISIKDNENVCLLEGNHEIHLWDYANDLPIKSKEFINYTTKQIVDIDKKQIRQFYRRLRQCAYFTYNDKTYFCCHAGISSINKPLVLMATNTFIKGVGEYDDIYDCANTFAEKNSDIIQICGHRNPRKMSHKISNNTYTLEGCVEFGGELRAVEISKDDISTISITNKIFINQEDRVLEEEKTTEIKDITVKELVDKLRENPKQIIEKHFDNCSISSFNFSKNVFYDKSWDKLTTKTRGLFINTETYTVASRSYEKFFNIGEIRETELGTLSMKFKFPVNLYVKYNGFLGILGYDEKNDKLLFCQKSSIDGQFSKYFENIFMSKYSDKYDEILDFVKTKNVSMVFEVIDKDNDPHIIEYKENNIILLDIVKRQINFKKFSYENLCGIANKFGFIVKEKAYTVNSWDEFMALYNELTDENYLYNGKNIEGFVIEDSNGFMVKVKGYYYNFWKFMRKVKDEVFKQTKSGYKGYIDRTSALTTDKMNLFYGFIKDLAKSDYNGKTDIITLRNLYEKEKK